MVVYPSALIGNACHAESGFQGNWRQHWLGPRRRVAWSFAAVIVYGLVRPGGRLAMSRQWKVALVQQNVDPWKGGYDAYRQSLDVLLRQSRQAITENPEIVIWSETSFVPAIDWHTRYRPDTQTYGLVQELRAFLDDAAVPYVVGNDDGELKRVEENAGGPRGFQRGHPLRQGQDRRHLPQAPPRAVHGERSLSRRQLPGIYQWLKNADTHFWEKGTVVHGLRRGRRAVLHARSASRILSGTSAGGSSGAAPRCSST